MYTDFFKQIFQNKNRVLAVFAHPDDAQLYSGGTISRLITEGIRVQIVKMTSHKVTEFLLVDYYKHPDLIYIDVAQYVDIRTQALACHRSQYSPKDAQSSTDFFTKFPDGSRRERFRYVIAD